jgi:DHA2 family multidrug resistance protein-like MFS transporter
MIDVRLFANRPFAAALAVNLMAFFVMVGDFLFFAQYLQLVAGLSPLHAGLVVTAVGRGVRRRLPARPAVPRRGAAGADGGGRARPHRHRAADAHPVGTDGVGDARRRIDRRSRSGSGR